MSLSIPSSTLEKFTTFGDLLRFLRRRVGLTQTELAVAVGYGHTQISRLEQNLRLPDIPMIRARFVPALALEEEPRAVERLLDLAANIRREDAPALGLCPYKGLAYFDEADADLFVGREALTARLAERVISLVSDDERFLAVVGASGSGKSSLVRAGLMPALRWNQASTDWYVHALTPTADPLESLASYLTSENADGKTAAAVAADLARDARGLHIFAREKLGLENGSRLLLVVDQFEELFALCRSEEERTSFIDNLLAGATEPGGPVMVVITLRADFYVHCANYPKLREVLARHQEYMGAMNDEELRRAIEEPAQRGRWQFERGLVDLLLHDVGHEPGALPLLSHALLETWQRRRGRMLTLSGYASSGGVRGAIAQTAESLFTDQFDHQQQAIARRIFLRLTELSDETSAADTRRRATFDELILKPEQAATTHAVLKALADARLITTSEDSAEVAHEALIREWPTLRSWLEDNREGLRLHRHLTEAAQDWLLAGREPDLLYRGARLAQVRERALTHSDELNALEHEFLEAAIAQSEREQADREAQHQRELDLQRQRADDQEKAARQMRRRAIYLTTALIFAGILAAAALSFSRRAAQQAQLSASRELAAAAVSNMQVDPERSILLALQAVDAADTAEGENALHQAVLASRVRMTLTGQEDGMTSVAMGPDGKTMATAGQDGSVILWDMLTGSRKASWHAHDDVVSSVDLSPDGSRLLTASWDSTAKVWDISSGELLTILSGHGESINRAVFDPTDGRRLATAGDDGTARIWDAQSGEELLTLSGQSDLVNSVAFSPDGAQLAAAQNDGAITLWDSNSGEALSRLAGQADILNAVAFSPDGSRVAAADVNGIITVSDATTGETLLTLTGHHEFTVVSLAFSPDGSRLASTSTDGTAKIWGAETGVELFTLVGHTGFVTGAVFSPGGASLITSSLDGSAKVWDLGPSHELLAIAADSDALSSVAISPDATKLATAGRQALVWDVESGKRLYELSGHTGFVHSVEFSPDGTRLATASDDGTARVWDANGGGELAQFPVGESPNIAIAFSPDGNRLAATGEGNTAKLWDAETGEELLTLTGHTSPVVQIAFNSAGTQLATAGDDGAKLWDATSGEQLRTFVDGARFLSVAFSPDGKRLATGGPDGTITLWDASSGRQILSLLGHTRAIFSVVFTPDGSRLASASGDGTVKLWDAKSGEELFTLFGHTGRVIDVAMSRDGSRLATAGQDGISRTYLLRIEDLVNLAQSHLTRSLARDECKKYLHLEQCPADSPGSGAPH